MPVDGLVAVLDRVEDGLEGVVMAQLVLDAPQRADRSRQLRRHQPQEVQVGLIQSQTRVDAHHERPECVLHTVGARQRDRHRLPGRLGPDAPRQRADHRGQVAADRGRPAPQRPRDAPRIFPVGQADGLREQRAVRPGGGDQPRHPRLPVDEVEGGERGVGVPGAQQVDELAAGFLHGRAPAGGFDRGRRQRAQDAEPSLAQHPGRGLAHRRADADHRPGGVAQRAVGVGEVALLEEPVAVARQEQVFRPAGDAVQGVLELRADDRPGLRPGLGARAAEAGGVLGLAEDGLPRIVVEHQEIRSPPDHHGEPGAEAGAEGDLERVRPRRGRPQRGPAPVARPDELGHAAAALEEPQSRVVLVSGHVAAPAVALALDAASLAAKLDLVRRPVRREVTREASRHG